MKAHIVGGGFGGLAAVALLIRNADMSGPDITIYEADETLGGGFFLTGDAKSGYTCLARSSIGSSAALWICSQRSPLSLPQYQCCRAIDMA